MPRHEVAVNDEFGGWGDEMPRMKAFGSLSENEE